MKKLVALFLAAVMVVSVVGCGEKTPADTNNSSVSEENNTENNEEGTSGEVVQFEGDYTFKDYVSVLGTNWNPHTMQTADDDYMTEYLRPGLYNFFYNDELHPVEGKEPYEGYVIVPEMAAGDPVDVTEQVKAEHPEFNIPETATSGYAYTIDLNPDAVWEDGTPIKAADYVYSMKQLLDPQLLNYRAVNYYDSEFEIANAEYYANQGQTTTISVASAMEKEGIATLEEYLAAHGDEKAFVNWAYSFGAAYDFDNFPFDGESVNPEGMCLEPEDAVVEVPLTLSEMYVFYPLCYGSDEGSIAQGQSFFADEVYVEHTYPEGVDFSTVGLYESGEYQITLVLSKALSGFNLYYNLGTNWLVNEELYEKCKKQDGDLWTNTYCTSVDTTLSYGPYKLVSFQADKALRLEKNENWYGYTDGKHIYVDPTDGLTYPMYQTTAIDATVVGEAATAKLMFLKGELSGYGLQAEDFATYRNSEYAYSTPQATLFFLILNGHKAAIEGREANDGFDQSKYDLQTMTLKSFRQAVAVVYDKELFAATISPARSGGYGLIGTPYVYDPDTGARYRDTDQAKKVLCDFYSVDVSKYSSLDEAVDSITGFDPEKAKELFGVAFNEALEAGYITDADGDGKSDQTVAIEYCLSIDDDFMTKTIDYLNEKMAEVTEGTPFEGKVVFTKSAPYGNEWSAKIRSGMSDTVLGGWTGSVLNPFSITDVYVNPAMQYDGQWFDASVEKMTMEVNGESLTMSLKKWSDALNGTMVTVDGKEYNFGEDYADVETRLDILAAFESAILQTYDYIPMMQNASMALLSQQLYYVVEEYNPVMGRGGRAYTKYNYNDADWAAYVADQGGELKY